MDNNLNALMNAANQKLDAQKKQSEASSSEDLYADMRQEMEQDEEQNIDTQRQEYSYPQEEYDIQHTPENEEEYELDPDDTPIFENGPGISQVEIWKKQFGQEKVFHTQILDKHFVFRTLNRYEYKQIVAIENIDALYREEIICHTCVLWPLHYDFKKMANEDSGYPSTLAQIIMENSGFTKEYGIEVL